MTRKITPKKEQEIQEEIQRLVSEYHYKEDILDEFARFILYGNKALSLPELKQAIYNHFNVKDTLTLKKSGMFKMASSSLGKINLGKKDGWETLYRKFIGILPHEKKQTGYGCINGIDIFKYDMPWQVFGLKPNVHSVNDVKASYRKLSKIYHPDNPETGDAKIFHRLTIFYESLTERL